MRGMGSAGAGGLIWLVATACGETDGGSDPEMSSNGSGGSTSSTGSTATQTGAASDTVSGAMGSNTVGGSTTGTGTTETSAVGSGPMGAGGTSSSSCPDIEPALGTNCDDAGLSCTFTNCTAPNYRNDHTLICEQGAWTLASEVECLANCPDTLPVVGSACEAQETPGPCPVETDCGTLEAYCVEDEWSLNASDRAPAPPDGAGGGSGIIGAPLCPETAPGLYTECCPANFPDHCDYTGGAGSDLLPPNTTSTTTGAQGSGGNSGTTGGTGGTGGTGASGLCLTCDPTRLEWVTSGACN